MEIADGEERLYFLKELLEDLQSIRLEMADGEERLDIFEEAWWTKLPKDLQDEALVWLPVDSILKYRSVSMERNSLLSSRKFLSGVWAKTPVNKKPRLLLRQ
jgi:hypothetical protein